MTTPVSSFARKARWHVVRIEGPVAWTAIHDLKGLHVALGHKIEELECMSTVSTATGGTPKERLDQPTPGSVRWSKLSNGDFAPRKRGTKTRRSDGVMK